MTGADGETQKKYAVLFQAPGQMDRQGEHVRVDFCGLVWKKQLESLRQDGRRGEGKKQEVFS